MHSSKFIRSAILCACHLALIAHHQQAQAFWLTDGTLFVRPPEQPAVQTKQDKASMVAPEPQANQSDSSAAAAKRPQPWLRLVEPTMNNPAPAASWTQSSGRLSQVSENSDPTWWRPAGSRRAGPAGSCPCPIWARTDSRACPMSRRLVAVYSGGVRGPSVGRAGTCAGHLCQYIWIWGRQIEMKPAAVACVRPPARPFPLPPS